MGALHKGHLSLLKTAQKECDISVVSIYVNPLQFNDPEDFKRYPRNVAKDLELLEKAGCDLVFAPSTEDLYGDSATIPTHDQFNALRLDLNGLDRSMEGLHRPGHFEGVCVVVKRLFDIVKSDKAYFGEKDFQQLAIIKHMVRQLKLPVKVIGCETLREDNGLACSSRNERLNAEQRDRAKVIYQTLSDLAIQWKSLNGHTVEHPDILNMCNTHKHKVETIDGMIVEYLDIVDPVTLAPLTTFSKSARACIAVRYAGIRLIDNCLL